MLQVMGVNHLSVGSCSQQSVTQLVPGQGDKGFQRFKEETLRAQVMRHPFPPVTSCVTLGNWVNLSVLQGPHPGNGDCDLAHFRVVVRIAGDDLQGAAGMCPFYPEATEQGPFLPSCPGLMSLWSETDSDALPTPPSALLFEG